MAELTTLARPYAKAAFEFARAAKDLSGWSDALTQAALVAATEPMQALFDSPSVTRSEKGEKFRQVCAEALGEKQQNFIQVLAENSRLNLLPEILELFELYKAAQEKTVDVDIQTAYDITPELEQKLAAALAKKLDRDVSLNTSVDKSLLGGALIRAGDTVIDGSVRGRLARLSEAMNA